MSSSSQQPTLAEGTCEPCKKGSDSLSTPSSHDLLSSLNANLDTHSTDGAWQILHRPPPHDSIPALERTYLFRTFRHALAFTNAVGAVAEKEGHHPALLTEWGSVRVAWWTHVIGGLHRNDFVMAAKTDAAFAEAEGKKKRSAPVEA
ncbi:unnamed protein product [Tilletia controversa]|uniref:4a-hydroxytetrahydrobiopterin dehydratase n=1 Tax=Tilletia controversa TaxID=13291 RepID=A0A8X7MT52_9BASI|nr:hypothetical protein CF328_g3393 [Tilletia controversa]KAE8247870.1 hypothetical protein A4X06_0g4128 [Tilletia controversa]CAD6927053.1 unnamed protein product [Tilletia controversa]CAD6936421.1 unnamed protein product [Tilletia controversa]CAD6955856.1 unnamed protein product [Tilletia controversa]